jgi:hypothetical protein
MRNRVLAITAALVLAAAGSAEAQIYTPSYSSPRPASETGIYLNSGPGNFSAEGLWRRWMGSYDFGLRGGVASVDNVALLLGAQLRGPVQTTAPLLLAWTADAQGVVGDRSGFGAGFGISVGALVPGEVTFVPYIHPRVAVVTPLRTGGGGDAGLELLADFGVDVVMRPNLTFRFALGLGGPTADFGVGFAWR